MKSPALARRAERKLELSDRLQTITYAPAESTTARKTVERWRRSIHRVDEIEQGKCGWRKHVDHSARVVLGYLISLAARDEEQFCWPRWKAIAKNAMNLGEPLGRSQIFAVLGVLMGHGIIVRARRFRCGAMRKGYIVRDHNDWSDYYPALGSCGLRSDADNLRRWEAKEIERRARQIHKATA